MRHSNPSCPEISNTAASTDGEPQSFGGGGLRSPSPTKSLPFSRSASYSLPSLFNGYAATSSALKRMPQKRNMAWYPPWTKLWLGLLIATVVFVNWWMLSRIQESGQTHGIKFKLIEANSSPFPIREELLSLGKGKRPEKTIYARLLARAAHALAELNNTIEPKDLWAEPYAIASTWKPCADQRDWKPSDKLNP
ncbi:unnamed protein product [Cuscuta epithymum]|uniref:Uncharacterized protein n=1 Tax=Cuscuta epithymum TaxID=186058 RepID=A0AAV0DP64_9ASTE|nr:unnamed protein product [Cuscuta epithymum]